MNPSYAKEKQLRGRRLNSWAPAKLESTHNVCEVANLINRIISPLDIRDAFESKRRGWGILSK
jgi:hypothetical protein